MNNGQLDGWIQTFSGKAYFYERPTVDTVTLPDIAHALANICRFGGHCSRFYSVAEHSVLVSQTLEIWGEDKETQMLGLMHDAAEAYVIDVPRPLKHLLGEAYAEMELRAWAAICEKFGLDRHMPPSIKKADNAVLIAEKNELLGEPPLPWAWAADVKPAPVTVLGLSPGHARTLFIKRYWELESCIPSSSSSC